MASPSSNCDTLPGSFSLPPTDLNLDDFLDLNEFEDVPDLVNLPFSPLDISEPESGDSQGHADRKDDGDISGAHIDQGNLSYACQNNGQMGQQSQQHQVRFVTCR